VTAHVFNSKLDPDYPATLSKPTITGLLRGEAKYLSKIANPTLAKLLQQVKLDYDGVVFSDDMQMKAITDHYGFKTAIRQAIDAGVDIIMLGNNVETFDKDIATRATTIIKQLIQEGILSEARINQSYQRIRRLKNRLATPT
jgi:beta-N-acetylhexosaminidase